MEKVFLPFSLRETGSPRSNGSDPSQSTKLFVGCLPYDATEEDLYPLFNKFGQITELTIQRDRSGFSKGCAWLKYTSREACDACIAQLHNQYYLGNVRSAMQVKFATNTSASTHPVGPAITASLLVPFEQEERALLLSGLPVSVPEAEVINAITAFGEISMFRQFANRKSDAIAVFTTAEGRDAFLNGVRLRGALTVAGIPCYTLRVDSSRGEQLYPSYNSLSPVSPSQFSPISSYLYGTTTLLTESSLAPVSPTNVCFDTTPMSATAPLGAGMQLGGFQGGSQVNADPPGSLAMNYATASSAQTYMAPAKLFVGCLPYSKTTSDLNVLFSQYGTILEVALLTTPEGRSKGAAFITFASLDQAQAAKNELDGYVFHGSTRAINVSFATNQTWRPAPIGPPAASLSHLAVGGESYPAAGGYGSHAHQSPVTLELDRHLDWSNTVPVGLSPTSANLQRLLNQIINLNVSGDESAFTPGSPLGRPPGFDTSPQNARPPN